MLPEGGLPRKIHVNSTRRNDGPAVKFETNDGILATIIVTHFNYSDFIKDALLSVAVQSHGNFECVIVDDNSQPEHLDKLNHVVAELKDERFRVLALPQNAGQTNAVFQGLSQSSGEFVALLDPDDIYMPEFLEKMLACHLNKIAYAAVASSEMGLFRIGGSKLTNSYVGFKSKAIAEGTLPRAEANLSDFGFSAHYPQDTVGWLWGTTSSLMFRRDALEALRRDTYMTDTKVHADTYCVNGAHFLGGTLFVDEVLSWRGLHKDNAAESPWVFSSKQVRHRPSFVDSSKAIRRFAVETLLENGRAKMIPVKLLAQSLSAHFSNDVIDEMLKAYPSYEELRAELRPGLWKKLTTRTKAKDVPMRSAVEPRSRKSRF